MASAGGIEKALGLTPKPGVEASDDSIMGDSVAESEQMLTFARGANSNFPAILPGLYLEIGANYGIRGDVAFCQMLLETGFHRFGGAVKPNQFNYAGIGATGGGNLAHGSRTSVKG